ncbi:phenylalanine--tRNA ligase subunit beta [Candidatus Tokpelaia sp.]|uniref:phenylalanine--tRNA ligase subunit beta n=1 Tax=Candidatus Tokpelaia sp. TaxID=2233777 RepID=UPI00123A4A96|nr:phenylalanine--tRNA ligase subunit beta [Candidatus Tokpelaia sp.]KAA6405608.1 phenylalanine--tRNA ligase subunit beta [Candidatus Tokpelaia sp.]
MKVPLSWLKEYLQTDKSLTELTDKLTAIGLEVEGVDEGALYSAFIVAKVVSAAKHPNADKLQILQVDAGGGALVQIVCGAPNARAGLVGVLAKPGTYIPGLDIVLNVGTIRGVESFGMMCSERELLLSDEHNGIIDLGEEALCDGKAKIGMSFAEYAGLDDPVIDIALTPNRADCASVYGIARDLAASGMGKLQALKIPALKPAKKALSVPVQVEDTEICSGFAAIRIEGLVNRPAPDWLQKRLRAIGIAPKNALVDISNYFTFAYGRPLHVFDADKVEGSLHVRRAAKGEKFAALNGRTYDLPAGCAVIADNSGVIALAGIMGGATTGCDDRTQAVIVESALWNSLLIARAGRKLSLVSDARYRFERGVDPEFMLPGLELAAAQIMDLCGTAQSKTGALTVAAVKALPAREIAFPLAEITRLTGLTVPANAVKKILTALGFKLRACSAGSCADWQVTVPSWRGDIEGKADLVEEVLRLYGVDKIVPQALPPLAGDQESRAIVTPVERRSRLARRALSARAMSEAVTYAFISAEAATLFGGGAAALKLANPIAATLSDMRPSLLPNLLAAAKRNSDRGLNDIALFEVADIYHSVEEAGQRRMAAAVRTGTAGLLGAGRMWNGVSSPVECFDAKADALAVLAAFGLTADKIQIERGAAPWYHPGRSGTIQLGPKNILGWFGEFHPEITEFFGLDKAGKQALCGFELFLDAVPEPRQKAGKTRPHLALSPFQQVWRDFSFIVDESVSAAAIMRAAAGADKKLISHVQIFDVFAGESLGAGKKAVGVEVAIQPRERSLTDEELEALSAKLIANVLKSTGGSLR